LEEIAETSPMPKLAKAAKLALQITKRVDSTIEVNYMINDVCKADDVRGVWDM